MVDQGLEGFRKASESSISAQQELLEQRLQQWTSQPFLDAVQTPLNANT
jgi:hypothetical protein